jgi:hypothetical protein
MNSSNLPAHREPSGPAAPVDAYEAAYMQPTGVAIRERTAVPGGAFAAVVVLAGVLAALAASWKLAVVGAVCGAWLLFAVLRVQVEADALLVHFGWIRRRIPLASISAVVTTRYSMMEGVGVLWLRKTARGLLFAVPGSGGGAVAVSFTDERGRPRTWILASRDPDALRDAIMKARNGTHDPTPHRNPLGNPGVQQQLGAPADPGD